MKQQTQFMNSIALMRGVAALTVVYNHLIKDYIIKNNIALKPINTIVKILNLLKINGGFGVGLFFLISGFIIPFVAINETRKEFIIKRLFRIYPPFWISVFFFIVLYFALDMFNIHNSSLERPGSFLQIISVFSLTNFLVGVPPLNAVAWTLLIEVIFYLWIAIIFKKLYEKPYLMITLTIILSLAIQLYLNRIYFLGSFVWRQIFVNYMFLGVLVYLLWVKRITQLFFIVFSIFFWGLFIRGVDSIIVTAPDTTLDYVRAFGLAYLIFLCFLRFESKIQLGMTSSFFPRISYSLYLYHTGVGLCMLSLLRPYVNYPTSLLFSLVIISLVSFLSYKYIEMPSQRLARNLIKKV